MGVGRLARDLISSKTAPQQGWTSLRAIIAAWTSGLLSNTWATAALIFVVTRAFALAGAYAGGQAVLVMEPERTKGWFAEVALMWDAAWYATIARDFYSYSPTAEGGTNVAFAPLYPFLVRALSEVLNLATFGWNWGDDQYGSMIAAGLIISNVSFFVALALLMRLLAPRVGKAGAAVVGLALASLPLAFFFSAMYTEGLFLLLVVASLLVARSDWRWKWLCAGLLGMMASLDRFTGILLLAVLGVEYLSQVGWRPRKIRPDVLWLALVPLGVGIYVLFLWWRFDNPFALNDSMLKGWNHKESFFLTTYWDSAVQLWQSVSGTYPPAPEAAPGYSDPVLNYGRGSRMHLILDMAMPILLLAGAFLARKKLLASEWMWLTLGIIYPLSTNITFSLARYMLPLWPGLIWLATLKKPARWMIVPWVLFSLALMTWCAYWYGSARWIG
jgi:hypothetical protein